MSSLIDGSGQEIDNLECACSKQANCHPSTENIVCNCDATPSVQDWLQDTINITDPEKLPIRGFNYGYLRGKAKFNIGKLFCKGGPPPVDVDILNDDVE